MAAQPHTTLEMSRVGRCARLAWEHAVGERAKPVMRTADGYAPRPAVMTGHVLLGVLEYDDCAGGLILAKMGLDLELAYKTTQFVLMHSRRREEPEEPSVEWEGVPHTPAALTVMEYSLEEANLFTATYPIGTEHLLLAILRLPDGVGCKVLRHFGIEHHQARAARDELWDLLRLTE